LLGITPGIGNGATGGVIAGGNGIIGVVVGIVGGEIDGTNIGAGKVSIGGVDAVGTVRVQAVSTIDPSPIINLKYFTLIGYFIDLE
jgi:hypothetical protein